MLARCSGRHGGILSRRPVGLAREAKGENPTYDLYLTPGAAELESGGFRSASPQQAVNPPDAQNTRVARGDVLTTISDGLVALLKEF